MYMHVLVGAYVHVHVHTDTLVCKTNIAYCTANCCTLIDRERECQCYPLIRLLDLLEGIELVWYGIIGMYTLYMHFPFLHSS